MRRPKLADDSYLHGFDWYWTSMVLTGIGLLCPPHSSSAEIYARSE
jgi:hypothetical protein